MQGPCRGLRPGHGPLWHLLGLRDWGSCRQLPSTCGRWTELAMPPNAPGGARLPKVPSPCAHPRPRGVLGEFFRPSHLGPGSHPRPVRLPPPSGRPRPRAAAADRQDEEGWRGVLPPRGSLSLRGLRGSGGVLSSAAVGGRAQPRAGSARASPLLPESPVGSSCGQRRRRLCTCPRDHAWPPSGSTEATPGLAGSGAGTSEVRLDATTALREPRQKAPTAPEKSWGPKT